jgi:alpha-tubulin suppressor-like RCC1 family protein
VQHVAYCWGENATGQLGDGTTTSRAAPAAVLTDERFSFIAMGAGFNNGASGATPPLAQGAVSHACALTEAGAPYCWGYNADGQLGDGTTTSRLGPVEVVGSLRLTSLAAIGSATCGRSGNAMWCWGSNAVGQLGTGSSVGSTTPVEVLSPFSAITP